MTENDHTDDSEQDRDQRWKDLIESADAKKKRLQRGDRWTARDLGLTTEMCEAIGLDPHMEYPINDEKRQEIRRQIEVLTEYGALVGSKYLLACVSMILDPDYVRKDLVRAATFLITHVMGSAPQRVMTIDDQSDYEKLREETLEVTHKLIYTSRSKIDGNGDKNEP